MQVKHFPYKGPKEHKIQEPQRLLIITGHKDIPNRVYYCVPKEVKATVAYWEDQLGFPLTYEYDGDKPDVLGLILGTEPKKSVLERILED